MAAELDSLHPITPSRGLVAGIRHIDSKLDNWIQAWNPYQIEKLAPRDIEPVKVEEGGVKRKITRFIMIAATIFFIWACLAPLDGGVTMAGNVVVAGYRKQVQGPAGGVVQAILMHEGDKVKEGQVLIRVNPLSADASLASAQSDYINVLVKESRLRAQSSGAATITWSPELAQFGNSPEIEGAKAFQVHQFNAWRSSQQQQEIALKAQMAGMEAAMSAHKIQLRSLAEELQNTRNLAKEGFVPVSQVNQAERTKADADSAMAGTQSSIGSIQAQLAELRSTAAKDISTEAADVQHSRETAETKLQSAKFDQNHTDIRAPVSGTVVGLQVFTVGGVISAGQVLAEIVPSDGKLVVETQVPSKSIDRVKVGGPVDLRFSAFNTSTTPVVPGRVLAVGVDRLKAKPGEEPKAGEDDFYLAQVETTAEGSKKLGALRIQPGMPVDVIIKTGERTFMSYLLKPLTDKFAMAFR